MRGIAVLGILMGLGLILALVGGCDDNIIDGQTRPALVDINGGMPVYADVFVVDTTLVGSNGYIPTESVILRFTNPQSHQFINLDPADPNAYFVIETYRIDYEVIQYLPSDAVFTAGTLPSVSGTMHFTLPVTDMLLETALVLVPASLKQEAPISDLLPPFGVAGELVVNAEITLHGHPQASTDMQALTGSVTILFGDYADED